MTDGARPDDRDERPPSRDDWPQKNTVAPAGRQGFSPYPKLKPSGVEWLGDVPEHWGIAALCRVTTDIRASNVDKHVRSNETPVKLCNYVDVYYNESIDSQITHTHGSATGRQVDTLRLREGDVLITKDSEVQDDIGVPALVVEHVPDLVAGYHLVLVRPDLQCLYGPYLFRALQSDIASLQFTHCAQGVTRYGMTYAGIRSVRLPIPTPMEQRAIAGYLDRETAKIDALIARSEVLIKRLKEQRAALISRTVTCGLPPNESRRAGIDPHPKLKPSGVEWLGDVPEHWRIERIKNLFDKMERPVRECDDVVTCFRDGTVTLRKNRREAGFTESIKEIGYQGIRSGDLVVHTMDAFTGAVGVSDSDGKATPVYSVCRPLARANASFYAYLIREMARRGWIQALTRGIRERSSDFRYRELGAQWVAVPPLNEQEAIVRFLGRMIGKLSKAASLAHRQTDLLREYRTRLISDVVTGKVDVRNSASAGVEAVE